MDYTEWIKCRKLHKYTEVHTTEQPCKNAAKNFQHFLALHKLSVKSHASISKMKYQKKIFFPTSVGKSTVKTQFHKHS